ACRTPLPSSSDADALTSSTNAPPTSSGPGSKVRPVPTEVHVVAVGARHRQAYVTSAYAGTTTTVARSARPTWRAPATRPSTLTGPSATAEPVWTAAVGALRVSRDR